MSLGNTLLQLFSLVVYGAYIIIIIIIITLQYASLSVGCQQPTNTADVSLVPALALLFFYVYYY